VSLTDLRSNSDSEPEEDSADAAQQDIRRAYKILVCIGDSKGQIHMNHIYLR